MHAIESTNWCPQKFDKDEYNLHASLKYSYGEVWKALLLRVDAHFITYEKLLTCELMLK